MLEPSPTTEQQIAELRELEQQFPPPSWEEVVPEWKWIHGLMADPASDLGTRHGGKWVAVYHQQIVGADYDPLALRIAKSRELGVHPERLVVTYVLGEWPGPRW
jgi:hypothetical protein